MEHQPDGNVLFEALEHCDWQEARRVCEEHPNLINTYSSWIVYKETPLLHAMTQQPPAPEDLMLLMVEKATVGNIEYENWLGETIISFLAKHMYTSALRCALEKSASKINTGDNYVVVFNGPIVSGLTPLHCCLHAKGTYDEQRETALCLIKYGASVYKKDDKGSTPLDNYNRNECIKYEVSTRKEKKDELKKLLIELSVPGEILARGPEAIKAFTYEVQNGEIMMVNSRVMFLGKEGVGKTSCVRSMLGKVFYNNEPSTDGIVTTTVFQTVNGDCSEWKEQKDVDVCELSKQIREHAIAENLAKKLKQPKSQQNTTNSASSSSTASSSKPSEATRSASYTRLPEGIHEKLVAKLAVPGTFHPPTLFGQRRRRSRFGTTADVPSRNPNQQHKESFIPSDVACIWDYAGQLTYYISHRFFLTDGSSYCVVFSVLDDLDALANPRDFLQGQFEMTNLQMNVFWMRSIYEHAVLPYPGRTRKLINGISSPTISLVATHKDKLLGNESEKDKLITTKFKRIFDEVKGTPFERHVDREMYVVDNTVRMDKGIEKLKKNIGGYMKATAKPIPTTWVDFQSKVQDVGKTRLRVSLDEVAEIASECGISKTTLNTVLDYLNDTGIILYSKTNEKLKYTVITNLRMMIDLLTKIITVVKPDDIDKLPTLMHLWNKLDSEGILQEKLLRHLWRREIKKDASSFEVFLELLKMFGLLFEKQKGSQPGNRMFLVPTRMQINKEGLEVKEDEQQMISIYVTPIDFLPDAVYNLLVVSFLDLMNDKGRSGNNVELFRNRSDFDLDDDHVVSLGAVEIKNRHALKIEISQRIRVDEHGKEETLEPHSSICMEVLSYLRQQLKTVYVTTEGVGYELRVLCHACDPTLRPLHKLEECLKKDSVPCGKRKSVATTRIRRLFSTGLYKNITCL
ncbi:uncharacterized protein LOC117105484 [Anneissia japonica]|uniref:uncharacterized protein LOC117105484 n=1 Tax=Anneissia japonica TaxID=1529436 RepID=UPI00142559FE|nr:uncharacterized protein LOC117105484 [Anneissia japonica]